MAFWEKPTISSLSPARTLFGHSASHGQQFNITAVENSQDLVGALWPSAEQLRRPPDPPRRATLLRTVGKIHARVFAGDIRIIERLIRFDQHPITAHDLIGGRRRYAARIAARKFSALLPQRVYRRGEGEIRVNRRPQTLQLMGLLAQPQAMQDRCWCHQAQGRRT